LHNLHATQSETEKGREREGECGKERETGEKGIEFSC